MSPRDEVLASYEVINGVITSCGKFEGEPIYAPYFLAIAGDGEELSFMDDGCGIYASMIPVSDEDRAAFPEIPASALYVVVKELDNGFVQTYIVYTEKQADEVRAAFDDD